VKTTACPPIEAWTNPLRHEEELLAHAEHCPACMANLEHLATAESLPDFDAPTDDQSTQDVLDQTLRKIKELPGEPDPTLGIPFEPIPERPDLMGKLGNYEVLRVVGKGGMGVVLEAIDSQLQRLVAIKLLAPHLAGSDKARKRFLREARAAAAVCHEHVLAIFSVEEIAGIPCMVMPLIHGRTLQQKLDIEGPLDLADTLRIASQAARGLVAAHARGLVHRDIKPANLLLESPHERVKLADFGLVQVADDCQLSQEGQVCGTPAFMSPEQARGESCEPRSDLFSLGSVMFTMLTGHSPFRASSTLALLRQVIEDHPTSLPETIPGRVRNLVCQMHAKKPAGRPVSAAAVADELDEMLNLLLVNGPDALELPEKRRKTKKVVVLATVASLLAGVFVSASYMHPKHANAEAKSVSCLDQTAEVVPSTLKDETHIIINGEVVTISGPGSRNLGLKSGENYQFRTQDGQQRIQILQIHSKDGQITSDSKKSIVEVTGFGLPLYLQNLPALRQFNSQDLPNLQFPVVPVPPSVRIPAVGFPISGQKVSNTTPKECISSSSSTASPDDEPTKSDDAKTSSFNDREVTMSVSVPSILTSLIRIWHTTPVPVKKGIVLSIKLMK
jgi:serine/threonine protein kinase